MVYMYHICFIHSSVNGHLGFFHVLARTVFLKTSAAYSKQAYTLSLTFQNLKQHSVHFSGASALCAVSTITILPNVHNS